MARAYTSRPTGIWPWRQQPRRRKGSICVVLSTSTGARVAQIGCSSHLKSSKSPTAAKRSAFEVANSVYWWAAVNAAEQVCLYGLSLSPTDVELTQTLRMGFDNHKIGPGTIFIINKENQLDIISRRLRRLAPDWKIERIAVEGILPRRGRWRF